MHNGAPEQYPHVPTAKKGSPQTAFDAAASMVECASSIRARVLQVVSGSGETGVNGDDVAESLDLHVTQVRSRLSELHAAKRIAESGRTKLGASGRHGTVWVLPQYAPPAPEGDQGDLGLEAA